MMLDFDKVLDGIARYIDAEIYPGMADWQEVLARIAVGRIFQQRASIKAALVDNGIVRSFGLIDDAGMVDVASLAKELREQIAQKGKLVVAIPMLGKMTFGPADVDKLYATITGGGLAN